MAFQDVVVLMLLLIFGCAYLLVTQPLEFGDASKISFELLARSSLLPSWGLALVRLSCGGLVWWSCWHLVTDADGLRMEVLMRDGSNKKVHLKHYERFTTFTVWCWGIQGIYYAIASFVSLSDAGWLPQALSPSPTSVPVVVACQAAWVLYEVSFSVAFLVSAVVTFVLIPATVRRGLLLDSFYLLLPLIMHNLNALNMALELSLNSLPFCTAHGVFVLLFGMSYVLFSWYWFSRRGIFYYFFLDYERPYTVLWHLGLMGLLGGCFAGGAALSLHVKRGSMGAFALLFVATFGVMKFPPMARWGHVSLRSRQAS